MELEQFIQQQCFDSLRTEGEVKQHWSSEVEPMVSIVCMCYNHVDYIEGALCGIFIQETNFPFEVLIHDDASTDGSADVIRRFEARYPSVIRATYQTENQYSQGRPQGISMRKQCRGRYLCSCEGDDFWIVAYKLQRQFDYMEQHPEVGLCYHSVYLLDVRTQTIQFVGADEGESVTKISVDEIMANRGSRLHTVSNFVRNENMDVLNRSVEGFTVGDVFLKMYFALQSQVVVLGFTGAVYRKFTNGSWSDRTLGSGFEDHSLKMILYVDQFYGYHRHLPNASKIGVVLQFYMLQILHFNSGGMHFLRCFYTVFKSIKNYSRTKLLVMLLVVYFTKIKRKCIS